MLLQCSSCAATYDVDAGLLSEPGVVVECERCGVPLAPVPAEAGPPQGVRGPAEAEPERTVMQAAFEAAEIEEMRSHAGPPHSPGPTGPARPVRPSASFDERTSVLTQGQATARAAATPPPASFRDAPPMPVAAPRARPTPLPLDAPPPAARVPRAAPGVPEPNSVLSPGQAQQRAFAPEPTTVLSPGAVVPPTRPTPRKLDAQTVLPAPARIEAPAPPARRDRTPADEVPPPPRSATPPSGQPAVPAPRAKAPVAVLAVAGVLALGLLAGSGVLIHKLVTRDRHKAAASGAAGAGAAKPHSFRAGLSLLLGRSEALFATVPGGEFPVDSVPVVITAESIAIREAKAAELDGGRLPGKATRGLLATALLQPLMRELTGADADAGDGAALGRGSGVLLVLAEATVPFETVGHVIYTAELAGFRRFLLGGVSDSNAQAAVAVAIKPVDWWPAGEAQAGDGLAVIADSADGFILFMRDGGALTVDGEERQRVRISKGMEFRVDKLVDLLPKVREGTPRIRRVTIQPDRRVPYETVLAILAAARGEDGDLFEDAIVGGGGLL